MTPVIAVGTATGQIYIISVSSGQVKSACQCMHGHQNSNSWLSSQMHHRTLLHVILRSCKQTTCVNVPVHSMEASKDSANVSVWSAVIYAHELAVTDCSVNCKMSHASNSA